MIELLAGIVTAIITGIVTYVVGRRQGRDKARAEFEAREHQAELDRQARAEERQHAERRELFAEVRALYADLRRIAAQLSNWMDKENVLGLREEWSNEFRKRMINLAAAPTAGEIRVHRIGQRLLWEFDQYVFNAWILTRQVDNHPHREYTLGKYNVAQGESNFLLLKWIEAIGGDKAPSRKEWPEPLHKCPDLKRHHALRLVLRRADKHDALIDRRFPRIRHKGKQVLVNNVMVWGVSFVHIFLF